jgi:hypothetical protein
MEAGRQIRDTHRQHYNAYVAQAWTSIRNFLSAHYRFNKRFDTPFWNYCRNYTPLHGAQPIVEFYIENGPSNFLTPLLLPAVDRFGAEGYFSLLLGQDVPFKNPPEAPEPERSVFQRWQEDARNRAERALTVAETLEYMKSPQWTWAANRPTVRDGQAESSFSVEQENRAGDTLQRQGRRTEAVAKFLEVLRRQPRCPVVHSNLLLALGHDPELEPQAVYAEHVWWDRLNGQGSAEKREFAAVADRKKRLRIGYVSPDLRRHAILHFIEPVLANHDAQQFEVFAYAEVRKPDAVTARLQKYFHHWHSTVGRTDLQVADQVRADGIDILIDLAGHTGGNRLGVFTHKPAPVQVTYLGYPSTTGLATIDYRLTDSVGDPPGEASYATEDLVRLPGCFCCYTPPPDAPEVGPLPAGTNGPVVFGSTHKLVKLNNTVLDLWARLLLKSPATRLVIARDTLTDDIAHRLRQEFQQRGVDSNRVDLRRAVAEPDKFLEFYSRLDIFLDVFPWCGHAMTCEVLWMGVPVVTLRGDRFAGRMGASLLGQLGLSELVADSPERYLAIAAELAGDRERLAALRAGLRQRMRQSALCDPVTYTRGLEETYRWMWDRWCARQSAP